MIDLSTLFDRFMDLLWRLVQPFVDFLLNFLPDGDPGVYSIIDGISNIGADMTFNVFYFCDWGAVMVCFGVMVTVILIVTVVKFVTKGFDMGHKAIESIPVIE